jgi:ribosomal 50S subunit-recycling heat shock protein
MRIDKFLKVARIIKRRSIAKQVADNERVKINGKTCKSSTKVEVDDIVEIQFGDKILVFKVLLLLDSTKKEDALNMFEILEEKRIK